MGLGALEVADIFRAHGPAFRASQRSHLSLGQLKVMSAIEQWTKPLPRYSISVSK